MAGQRDLDAQVLACYQQWDSQTMQRAARCPWCTKIITEDMAMHHWLVKRSRIVKDKQHLINVVENLIPVHNNTCHLTNGSSREMTTRCLRHAAKHVELVDVGKWYVSLWRDHGLGVPKGLLMPPAKMPMHQARQMFAMGYLALETWEPDDMDWSVGPHDARDMAWAKWAGRWKIFKKQGLEWPQAASVPAMSPGAMLDQVERGYWYAYLINVIA